MLWETNPTPAIGSVVIACRKVKLVGASAGARRIGVVYAVTRVVAAVSLAVTFAMPVRLYGVRSTTVRA